MQPLILSSGLVAGIVILPALVFAALGFLTDVPAEWARGALTAWTAVVVAVIAGATAQAGIVPVAALAAALTAALALFLGGPTGLLVSAVAAGGLLVLQLAAGGLPVHAVVLPVLTAAALAVWLRQLFL